MNILINHLTRMSEGYICVAGIDLDSRRHIRPVLEGRLSKELLNVHGGPFEMAAIVDLGNVVASPQNPETEDHGFSTDRARRESFMAEKEFWTTIKQLSKSKLTDIFGPELRMRGPKSCGVDAKAGRVSLGVLAAKKSAITVQSGFGGKKQIRLNLSDGTFELNLGVTDIRFYSKDHITPDAAIVSSAEIRLAAGEDVLFSMGLTRAMSTPGFAPVHWLQVNNIHFSSKPTWRTGEPL